MSRAFIQDACRRHSDRFVDFSIDKIHPLLKSKYILMQTGAFSIDMRTRTKHTPAFHLKTFKMTVNVTYGIFLFRCCFLFGEKKMFKR